MLVQACKEAKDSIKETEQKFTGKRKQEEKEPEKKKTGTILDRLKKKPQEKPHSRKPRNMKEEKEAEKLELVKIDQEGPYVISLSKANNSIRKQRKTEAEEGKQEEVSGEAEEGLDKDIGKIVFIKEIQKTIENKMQILAYVPKRRQVRVLASQRNGTFCRKLQEIVQEIPELQVWRPLPLHPPTDSVQIWSAVCQTELRLLPPCEIPRRVLQSGSLHALYGIQAETQEPEIGGKAGKREAET
eukprot:TRINITY_DN381_c2_g1_i1.p10 TRINITY_DN381_c2_g1~~TRINITY_DN381_c2_g1_i1.p10  ORF type:complete len:243 (-),score=33.50 TRINITY_DN381_c2_g1_i1:3601-4329(-)